MLAKLTLRLGAATVVVLGAGAAAASIAATPATAAPARPSASTAPSAAVTAPTLFATNYTGDTVTSYPLTATGDASPAATISSTARDPWQVAFDGSGDLWVADCASDTVTEYTPAQLAASGTELPALTLASDGAQSLDCPQGLAFDGSGDLWVANVGGNSLVEYTPAELAAGGAPTPAVTIAYPATATTPPVLSGPYGLTFHTGDLWVTNYTGNSLVEYTPAELAAGGAPTPSVVVTATTHSLTGPTGLAFDASGDLWVTNYDSDSLVEYTPAELVASGAPIPVTTIAYTVTSPLAAPADLAFDATGDLWVTNNEDGSLVEYTPAQLATGGAPTPAVTVSSDATASLDAPAGLAFDAAGDLWVANNADGSLVEYTPAQLATGGAPTPAITVSSGPPPSLLEPVGEAVDAAGDLWVGNIGNDSVAEYTPTELGTSGAEEPAVTITAAGTTSTTTAPIGLDGPAYLAFDASGDLWVASFGNDSLVEYTPAQLATSGDPTPAVTISSTGTCTGPGTCTGSLDYPTGLAFDGSGDLWVSNPEGRTLVEYTPAQLATSGDPTPAVTISSTGTCTGPGTCTGSLDAPFDVAFDGSGDLWVTNTDGNSLVEYTPTQLATSGAPTPVVTISSTGTCTGPGTCTGSLDLPAGLAFDPSGDLWVANNADDSLVEYTPAQLASGGAPTPADTIAGTATGLSSPEDVAVVSPPPAPTTGYWEAAADGGVFSFGSAQFYGSMGGKALNAPVVGMAAMPGGSGYWEVASDGGVFSFGSAQFYGSMGGKALDAPVVGIAAALTGKGYWEVASDGGVFSFGSAQFYGSMGGKALDAPVVGIAAAPTGKGYWEVASDGGIFSFGSAQFYGSMGGKALDAPVVGIAAAPTGKGYWEVASDGGVFSFGSAQFYGSMGGKALDAPVVGIAAAPTGEGYWEVAADGGVFSFGSATYEGSMGGKALDAPVVGIAAT